MVKSQTKISEITGHINWGNEEDMTQENKILDRIQTLTVICQRF